MMEEFFSSEDVQELIVTVKELKCDDFHYELVKKAISMSLDRTERERELVSRFLSTAYPEVLPTEQLGKVSTYLLRCDL